MKARKKAIRRAAQELAAQDLGIHPPVTVNDRGERRTLRGRVRHYRRKLSSTR